MDKKEESSLENGPCPEEVETFAKGLWLGDKISSVEIVPGVWFYESECSGGFIVHTGITGCEFYAERACLHQQPLPDSSALLGFDEDKFAILVLLFVPTVLEADYHNRKRAWEHLRTSPMHDKDNDFLSIYPTVQSWKQALLESYKEGVRRKWYPSQAEIE